MATSSRRPYLIRACYQWIIENQQTPFVLVDAGAEGVQVPGNYVENGRIILNVGPSAVQGLELGDDEIHFSARFDGSAMRVSFPPRAVLGIYARERHELMNMLFPETFPEEAGDDQPPEPDPDSGGAPGKKPSLKVVK